MQKTTGLSVLNQKTCNISSLIHQEHHRDYELWLDRINGKEYYQYKLYGWPNDKQMQTYQFRKIQKDNVVYVHYLSSVESSGFKQFRVFIEKIHLVFTTLMKFSFVQGLYLIQNTLLGFKMLYQKFGYVHIDNKLIGLNAQGKIKVWINQNFAFNTVAMTHLAPKWMNEQMKQKQMVATIFAIIEDKLQKNQRLRSFKKQKQLKVHSMTFQNTLKFIQVYLKTHNVKLPSSLIELVKIFKKQNTTIQFGRGSINQKPVLSFKKTSPTKRKGNNKSNVQSRNFLNSGSPRAKRLYTVFNRFLSPNQDSVRGRNRSQAGFSIASSRPRTTFTLQPPKPTKYFYCNKSQKSRFQASQRENNFLQSSQISKVSQQLCFNQPIKNQVIVFNNNQKPSQSQSQKKRKYSAADKMILNGLSIASKVKQQKSNTLTLARSMILKNKLQDSRKAQKIIEQQQPKIYFKNHSPVKTPKLACSPSKCNPQNFSPNNSESKKVFVNYKPVNKSIIKQTKEEEPKNQLKHSFKNSFLKNIELKSSDIIMQRSSEYASIHDIMKTIKQSQIQTPLSEKGFQTFAQRERNYSLFVPHVAQKRSSDINISNSTTDRKSGLQQSKDGGLLNISSPTKPKQLKQGIFKSILVQQSKEQDIKQKIIL